MNTAYAETLQWLYDRLPMYSRVGSAALKPNLNNTIALCKAIGNPQQHFPTIHIAGTNGKGSTSHMLAAILQKSGFKTGLYTSPHLLDFRERIRINGKDISEQWVVDFVDNYRSAIEEIQPSFFEITVAMAFLAFAEVEVDIAVIETGLGGRLDSTNIITPVLSIITNIGLDHTDLLGTTLPEIAVEKAGIIKPGVPILIGELQEETERVFSEKALANRSPLYYADSLWSLVRVSSSNSLQSFKAVQLSTGKILPVLTDLIGKYQQQNIATVLAATDLLIHLGWNIGEASLLGALQNVKSLTGLRGRWEILQQEPLIIADVAHNAAGLKGVMEQWDALVGEAKHIVIGMVKEKDLSKVLPMLPPNTHYHVCNAAIERALPAQALYEILVEKGFNATCYTSVKAAVLHANASMKTGDALLITGSFFTVAEALELPYPLLDNK